MISITGETSKYILQPAQVEKHRKTLDWLAETIVWKAELKKVVRKILGDLCLGATQIEYQKRIDHFQNLIIYYSSEVVVDIQKKLRAHEEKLAKMLEITAEWDIEYYRDHDILMGDAEVVKARLAGTKTTLLAWNHGLKSNGYG